jgi:hypothetical protein
MAVLEFLMQSLFIRHTLQKRVKTWFSDCIYLCMRKRFKNFMRIVSKCDSYLFYILVLFSQITYGKNDRVELIQMANEGLNFFFISAFHNPQFVKSLTPKEIQMAAEFSLILEQKDAIKFYESQNIQGFQGKLGSKFYGFVDQNEKVSTFAVPGGKAPEIKISNQRDQFINLKPNEPERFLKTTSDFSGPILVNQLKLNDDSLSSFDLGQAVSILVHEYGHKAKALLEQKLGYKVSDSEYQPLVDQFGIKLGEFVRSKIMKFPMKNGVTVYALNNLGFPLDIWMQDGFIKGQSILSLVDHQGLYFWTEFDGEIRDISKKIRSQFSFDQLPKKPQNDKYYHFTNLFLNLPSKINVTESEVGKINFQITVGQAGLQLPYMIPGVSPDPKQVEFNKRYRWSEAGYTVNPKSQNINAQINGSTILINKTESTHRQISLAPGFTAQRGRIEWKGNDLQFIIEVPDKEGQLTFMALTRNLFLLSSEIKIKTNTGDIFYLTSDGLDPSKANTERIVQYVFSLKDAKNKGLNSFEIENVYLRTVPEIISENSEVRIEIPLFEKLKFETPQNYNNPINPVHSTEIKLVSVVAKNQLIKMNIRSADPIQRVSLVLDVTDLTYSLIDSLKGGEKVYYKFTENIESKRTVQIEVTSDQFATKQNTDGTMEISFDLTSIYKLSVAKISEASGDTKSSIVRALDKNIQIKEVGILNTSLQSTSAQMNHQITLDSQIKFNNKFNQILFEFSQRPQKYNQILKGLCEGLFN